MERLEITAQKLNAMRQNKVVPLHYLQGIMINYYVPPTLTQKGLY